jgi:hypothetical protein
VRVPTIHLPNRRRRWQSPIQWIDIGSGATGTLAGPPPDSDAFLDD